MGIERGREEIKVTKSKDTGHISVKTTIPYVDTRKPTIHMNDKDAIVIRENRTTKEQITTIVFFTGFLGGVVGGIVEIIEGVEKFNLEQVGIGSGAVILGLYFLGSARKHFYEKGLAGREINEIKKNS